LLFTDHLNNSSQNRRYSYDLSLFLVPATITVPPQNVSLVTGFNLNLTCIVYGDPLPSVYWMRNGSRDISGAVLTSGNTSLVIKNASIEDEGVYTCVTVNRAGNDSQDAAVEVRGLYVY